MSSGDMEKLPRCFGLVLSSLSEAFLQPFRDIVKDVGNLSQKTKQEALQLRLEGPRSFCFVLFCKKDS